ncbi:MAG: response regulator transcription factor [Kiritimatiellaeota bacterium]|nr:response regulator transcription factor [Kiritimatiellota bacterium]
MIKVALVDDQENVRRTLCRVLASDAGMRCVAACVDGEEALQLLPAAAPDVVLMDLEMPGMKGSAVTARLLEKMPDLDVLVLTVHDDTENIFQALRAGACGYLLKRTPAAGILAAIREVRRGGAPMTGAIARKILATFHKPAAAAQPAEDHLSQREQSILNLLAQGQSNKEIAEHLKLSVETICWNLKRIYRKLHVQSRTQAMLKYRPPTS